jgi:hypothetical protein
MTDLLGHVAYAALTAGQIGVADGMAIGWAARIVGEAIWIGLGLRLRMSSIVLWGILGLAVEVHGLTEALR